MFEQKLVDLKILIVDDDPYIIQSLTRTLKHAKIDNIISSDSASLALKKMAGEGGIDIVISDLKMPGLDGIQLIRHLSDQHQDINLILISGESEHVLQAAENIAIERKINILGTLKKPIKGTKLISMLSNDRNILHVRKTTYEPISLEIELRKALQNNTFSVHYQPQINSNTDFVGVEALARWQHDDMGMVPPSIFIPLAENLNLINILTEQINNKVFKEFPRLAQDHPSLTVSINFSHDCLSDLNLPEKLEENLEKNNLVTKQVIIEITESLLTQDLTTSLDILARLRLKGFGLSIDDFGTGFSTMEQVSRIPFTELKIDRNFVHGAKYNKVKKAILESSIALAKKIDMKTVAEGVEDDNDLEIAKQLGCDIIQGYYYAKPMPIDELCSWVASRQKEAQTADVI